MVGTCTCSVQLQHYYNTITYLDFEESRTKSRPPSDILQEADLCIILRANGVAVVVAGNHLLPVVWRVGLHQIHRDKLAKHGTVSKQNLMRFFHQNFNTLIAFNDIGLG